MNVNVTKNQYLKLRNSGSGGGSVGRVVASDTVGHQFEYNHRQYFKMSNFTVSVEKTNIKKNRSPKFH